MGLSESDPKMLICGFVVSLIVIHYIRTHLLDKYDKCYSEMETQGIAVFEMCGGVVGGDKGTEYLDYKCIDCPYYVGFDEYRKEKLNEFVR